MLQQEVVYISTMTRVTVLLPVYNAARYVKAAVQSVRDQTFSDFECLLLDDGSFDGSKDILDEFANMDPRFKVHSWANCGVAKTSNRGLAISSGELIMHMDADDISFPDRFAKQVDFLEHNPACVALGTKTLLMDSEDFPICEFGGIPDHDAIDSEHMAGRGGALANPTALIKKSALLSVGGYCEDNAAAHDIDLYLRLAEVGLLANLPEILLLYRQHSESMGYKRASEQILDARKAVRAAKVRRNILDNNASPELRPEVPTIVEQHRKWAWWALNGGNFKTARKHAFKAFAMMPTAKENIRLLACVLRGF